MGVESEKHTASERLISANDGTRAQSSSRKVQDTGLTTIILSYERMKALTALLKSLLQQHLNDLDIELILFNNSSRIQLTTSPLSRIGRLSRKFSDVKIVNSIHNWRDSIRYALATVARYETILFLDDDITLLDPNFIRYMFDTFRTLRPVDILSCWNTLWVDWQNNYFSAVSLAFTTPEITELTECDTCGTGICMFNKSMLLNPKILEIAMCSNFPQAYDMGFSLIAAMECDSRRYYLPSHGMLKFHKQYTKKALSAYTGHYEDRYGLYKSLFNCGYKPVLSKLLSESKSTTPEWRAARILPVVKHHW